MFSQGAVVPGQRDVRGNSLGKGMGTESIALVPRLGAFKNNQIESLKEPCTGDVFKGKEVYLRGCRSWISSLVALGRKHPRAPCPGEPT